MWNGVLFLDAALYLYLVPTERRCAATCRATGFLRLELYERMPLFRLMIDQELLACLVEFLPRVLDSDRLSSKEVLFKLLTL